MSTATQLQSAPAIDYEAIKTRQQAMWASGNYARIGSTLQYTGESLCEAMDVGAGQLLLDVAAGNGNATLAAARRFCQVVSTDYVPELLEQSQARAQADGLAVSYQLADAEALPFADASFDHVVSTFGVMFAPDQARAAAELQRVCRPGGKIGLVNWTPQGFIGQLLKTVGRYVPPPAGVNSAVLWGTEAFIHEHFAGAAEIRMRRCEFVFRYLSAEHMTEVFRTYYGPTFKAFSSLPGVEQERLAADMRALMTEYNRATDGSLKVPSEYLEIVITC